MTGLSRPKGERRGAGGNFSAWLRARVVAEPPFDWNDQQDTRYAHIDTRFDRVFHIFHRQWLGIRAAAGSLPGNKLAINAHKHLNARAVDKILALMLNAGALRYVFHGMSSNAATLIRQLSKRGLASQVFIVYHGNVTQWYDSPERKLAFQALRLAQDGHVRSLHMLKPGHMLLDAKCYTPMLLNMSPILGHLGSGTHSRSRSVLIPGTWEWRKNLHCNAMGAAMVKDVEQVIHYSSQLTLPTPWQSKLRHTPFQNRESTFKIMRECIATLNVSLSECHPMVAIESEAVGTPCLRAPLFLDALESHPYVKLVQVDDPTNPYSVRNVLQRILTFPHSELEEIMLDYSRGINALSITRYLEFLEL